MAKSRRSYKGGAVSNVLAGSPLAAGGTTITVASDISGSWPTGSDPFFVVIDPGTAKEEKVCVQYYTTTSLKVVDPALTSGWAASANGRGCDDTTDRQHEPGAVIYPVFTALEANQANEVVSKYTTNGDIVVHGTTTVKTISTGGSGGNNKVLVADSTVTDGGVKWSTIVDANVNASAAIALSKLATGALPTGITVASANLTDLTIATADIADLAVTTAKIADGAITTAKIADLSIIAGDIADGAITSAKILDGTIVEGDIANGAITSAKILDGTIVAGDIADGAITSAKILDGTIVAGDIANGAVTSAKILDGTIATADLADGAVTAAKKSGFYGLTYQDFTITGVANDTDAYIFGSDHVITFTGGKTFYDVVSIVPLAGVNSTVTLYHIELGAQGGVLNNNQARVNCSISNSVDTGGSVNVRVWFTV